jgi:predicted ArsR family transcriptional regulator
MASRISESVVAGPGEWTFLTNHAHVLLCLAVDPEVRLRDVADSVGITERAAQRIVMELEDAGYLERERVGRRNRYRLHGDQPLRHPKDRDHRVSELLTVLSRDHTDAPRSAATKKAAAAKKSNTSAAKARR